MSGGALATAVVAQARTLIGAPFRLHGRDERRGVDCVGLAALAFLRAGHRGALPPAYGLRLNDVGRVRGWLAAAGLARVGEARPGDLLLVRPGPVQLHLMIAVPDGFVHAHAGLGRVVECPGPSPWPVIGVWRAIEE